MTSIRDHGAGGSARAGLSWALPLLLEAAEAAGRGPVIERAPVAVARPAPIGQADAAASLHVVLDKALEVAMSLLHADRGNIQLADSDTSLRIAVQCGFSAEFLEYFALVADDSSACGRAASAHARTVVADVSTDPAFAPHRQIAAASGFRAVQSTPLLDDAGRLVGVLSTHYPRPCLPPAAGLQVMTRFARLIGQVMSVPPDAQAGTRRGTAAAPPGGGFSG